MSKNNLIRRSDKKFIRSEKARIRRQFLDVKKHKELIDKLYERFLPKTKNASVEPKLEESPKEVEVKKENVKVSAKGAVGKAKAKKSVKN